MSDSKQNRCCYVIHGNKEDDRRALCHKQEEDRLPLVLPLASTSRYADLVVPVGWDIDSNLARLYRCGYANIACKPKNEHTKEHAQVWLSNIKNFEIWIVHSIILCINPFGINQWWENFHLVFYPCSCIQEDIRVSTKCNTGSFMSYMQTCGSYICLN